MWSLYFYADKRIYFIYTFCCFLLTESPVLADTNWLMIPFSWQKRWCLSAFTVLMCSRSTVDKKSSACNSHVFERKQKKASVYTLVKMVWICLMYEGRANKAPYRWYVTSTSAAEATHCCDISHVEGVTQIFFFLCLRLEMAISAALSSSFQLVWKEDVTHSSVQAWYSCTPEPWTSVWPEKHNPTQLQRNT